MGAQVLLSDCAASWAYKRSKRVAWLPQNLPAKFTAALKDWPTSLLLGHGQYPYVQATAKSVAFYTEHVKDAHKKYGHINCGQVILLVQINK